MRNALPALALILPLTALLFGACHGYTGPAGVRVTETRTVETLPAAAAAASCHPIGKTSAGRIIHYCPDEQGDDDDLIIMDAPKPEEK